MSSCYFILLLCFFFFEFVSGSPVSGPSLPQSAAAMAEFGRTGLLAALLFFVALTVRDIQLSRSDRRGSSADVLPGSEPGRAAKYSLKTGPVLRFQYW